MFSKSADVYNAIYLSMGKDYASEEKKIDAFIRQHKHSKGNSLLDVACGTGLHLEYLRKRYQVEGLDLDREMIKIAREKYPAVSFHQANMLDFKLQRQFDVITCLFSSIGYVRTVRHLNQAIRNMSVHLKDGGILLVEPWFAPSEWKTGNIHLTVVNQPKQKIVRINVSGRKGKISILNFHYLVANPKGVKYFYERHELGLFTKKDYLLAFKHAGLKVHCDHNGIDGRGLYIATKIKS